MSYYTNDYTEIKADYAGCPHSQCLFLDSNYTYSPEFFECPKCNGPDWIKNLLELSPCKDAVMWMLDYRDSTSKEVWKKCKELGWLVWVQTRFGTNRRKIDAFLNYMNAIEVYCSLYEEYLTDDVRFTTDMNKCLKEFKRRFPNPPPKLDEKVSRVADGE